MTTPVWMDKRLDLTFDGANFEALDAANSHNEAKVGVSCDRNDWFNDKLSLSSYRVADEFIFQVSINSEVKAGLFNDGTVTFVYDIQNGKWKMNAMADGAEWLFCDPKAALDALFHGIGCFLAAETPNVSDEDKNAVRAISRDIAKNADSVIEGAHLYKQRADCTAVEPGLLEKIKNGFIEHGAARGDACLESHGFACDPM